MKTILYAAIIGVAIAASTNSFAETGQSYFGVGYHMGSYDETGAPKVNLNGIKIKGGKYITDTVAIEGHFVQGIGSDEVEYGGYDFEVKLKNLLSVFLKADMPLSKEANVYGLIGFSKGKLEFSVPAVGYTETDDDSGLSYGFGVEVEMGKDLFIGGEYIVYLDESDYDYTGFNIGISKLF